MPLAGRVAVVTGAGRGLGRTHALELARLGASVVVNDVGSDLGGRGISPEPAAEVAEAIRRLGGRAVAHVGSVCDASDVEGLLDVAVSEFGHVDSLVNNAGFLRNRFLLELTEEDWDAVMEVHLKATFLTLQRFGRYWRDQAKAGRALRPAVVNTTSAAGLQGSIQQANYVAAKAGVAMLTVAAAAELARYGVRVNAVAPLARTRLTMDVPQTAAAMGEPGDGGGDPWAAEHVAHVVAWLTSPGCRFNGHVFAAHGGVVGICAGWDIVAHARTQGSWDITELEKATADFPTEFAVTNQTDIAIPDRTDA